MDSNFWYRGTKAVDFRSIPGNCGGIGGAFKRYHLMVQPFFCASTHSIEPGWGLSRLWRAALRGGFCVPAVQLKYTFARHPLDEQVVERPHQGINAVRRIPRRGPAANSSRKSNSGAAPNKVDSIGMENDSWSHRRRYAQIPPRCPVASLQSSGSCPDPSEPAGERRHVPGRPTRSSAGRARDVPAQPGRSSWGAPRCIKPPVDLSTSAPPGRRSSGALNGPFSFFLDGNISRHGKPLIQFFLSLFRADIQPHVDYPTPAHKSGNAGEAWR